MRRRRTVLFATGALVAIAAVLSLSAASLASSSNTSAATGVAAAKAAVAKAMKAPVWAGPTTKVDISKAKGKKVYFINLTEGIPALHEWSVVLAGSSRQPESTRTTATPRARRAASRPA